jgi:hypothetical protein
VVAVLATGCGELGADWRGLRLEPPRRTSPEDVARLPAGSPQRAFLTWYAAVQRRDAATAASVFDRSAGITAQTLGAYWRALPPPRSAAARIVDVDRRSRRATVFVELRTRYVAPNGRAVEFRVPGAATLVRSERTWRLPQSWFLRSLGDLEKSQQRMVDAGQVR